MSKNGMNVYATEAFVEEKLANAGPGFSGDYNDLKNAPNIVDDESGEVVYADDKGNIIARIGEAGFETTRIIADTITLNNTDMNVEETEQILIVNKNGNVEPTGFSTRTYKSFADLGLDETTATIPDIVEAMPSRSTIILYTGEKTNPDLYPANVTYGTIVIHKYGLTRSSITFESGPKNGAKRYHGSYYRTSAESVGTWSGWIELANHAFYNSWEELGLDHTSTTIPKVVEAMVNNSTAILTANSSTNAALCPGNTNINGTIVIHKINNTRSSLTFEGVPGNGNRYHGSYYKAGDAAGTWSGWTAMGVDNATASSSGLMSAADKTKLNNTNIAYGTCDTAAATAAKVITITGNTKWTLAAGSRITIKFSATNTASNPTFNVNGTGAKPVVYNTAVIATSNLSYAGYKDRYMDFVYNGTQYVFVGWSVDTNSTYTNAGLGQGYGTCDTATSTAAKVVTLSSYALTTGGVVAVKFTNAVPASATMNINSKGAKAIFNRGAAIAANVIKAGDIATFIYDGTQYHLLTVDRDNNTTYSAAGSSLGLVKSGGDVTISSGVITVNGKAPAYTYGTEDLIPGESALATGVLHFVYE